MSTKEPEINPEVEELKIRISELENQVASLEGFANAVAQQRNEAQNQSAQYLGQLTAMIKKGQTQ